MITCETMVKPSPRRPTATLLVAVMLVALTLAGCGKRGSPQPPADEPSTYPKAYPVE